MNECITNNNTYIQSRKQKARFTVSFHIYENEKWILDGLETLRRQDGWDQTRAIKEALAEYVKRHIPGNPSLPLEHWTENLPFSEAAREKLQPKPKLELSPTQTLEPCPNCDGSGKGEFDQVCYSCRGERQIVVTKYV